MARRPMPYMPVYVEEEIFRNEPLRSCSMGARGLWMHLRALMWRSPRRGYLLHEDGSGPSLDQLARLIGLDTAELNALRQELISSGLLKVNKDGVLYDPITLQRAELSAKRSRAGKVGGKTTALLRQTVQHQPRQTHGIYSSSEGEIPKEEERQPQGGGGAGGGGFAVATGEANRPPPASGGLAPLPPALDTPEVRSAWSAWRDHLRGKGCRPTLESVRGQLDYLAGLGPAKAAECLRYSTRQGYTGLHLPGGAGAAGAGAGGKLSREEFLRRALGKGAADAG